MFKGVGLCSICGRYNKRDQNQTNEQKTPQNPEACLTPEKDSGFGFLLGAR
jgi:hypothetical protein